MVLPLSEVAAKTGVVITNIKVNARRKAIIRRVKGDHPLLKMI